MRPVGMATQWCHRQPVRVGPEPWTGDANAHMKDAIERYLNREVCRGTMSFTPAWTPASLVLRSPPTGQADHAQTCVANVLWASE
jgi:hypothetical protein